jgi:hypothetical protein
MRIELLGTVCRRKFLIFFGVTELTPDLKPAQMSPLTLPSTSTGSTHNVFLTLPLDDEEIPIQNVAFHWYHHQTFYIVLHSVADAQTAIPIRKDA